MRLSFERGEASTSEFATFHSILADLSLRSVHRLDRCDSRLQA